MGLNRSCKVIKYSFKIKIAQKNGPEGRGRGRRKRRRGEGEEGGRGGGVGGKTLGYSLAVMGVIAVTKKENKKF